MASPLNEAILELAARHDPHGVSMGIIVDTLAGEGFDSAAVETAIWALMANRRLTPCGFVARRVRRRDATGQLQVVRTYEFLLTPWSRDMDNQLELSLVAGDRDR
jgi:hypothetical protein